MRPDIVYHGGGYAGLTGAVHFALVGKQVLIYDPDETVVDAINAGTPKAGEFLRYLQDYGVRKASDPGPALFGQRVRATCRFRDVLQAPVHIIAATSEHRGQPAMSVVLGILDRLVRDADTPMLIIVESTLTPGTVDQFLNDNLAGGKATGRMAVESGAVRLAVAPRRDWFADPKKNVRTLARVVGGVTNDCTAAAVECLSHVSDVIHTTDYRTAELVKPLENALLHVPLMMVHELAFAYPEHDVAEAVRLAGTHWRLFPLHLNFGAGGRCVPLGPKYLIEGARGEWSSLLAQAVDMDHDVRGCIASWVAERLYQRGQKDSGAALVLGLAYRPDFRDAGSSPGVDIAKLLISRGIRTIVHDPMWTVEELQALVPGAEIAAGNGPDGVQAPSVADVVLLSTPHTIYRDWPLRSGAWKTGQIVLDAQGAWRAHQHVFRALGVDYRQVGKPGWTA